jgi:hypothetical protein
MSCKSTNDSNPIHLSNIVLQFLYNVQAPTLAWSWLSCARGLAWSNLLQDWVSSPKYEFSLHISRMVDLGEMSRYSVQCPRESRFEWKRGRKASASFSPNNYKCICSKEHWPRPKFDGCVSLIGLSLNLFRYKILEGWSFSRKHANILARKVLVQAKLHGVLEFCKLSETGFCSIEQPEGYWGFRVFVLFVLSLWKSHGILERIFF